MIRKYFLYLVVLSPCISGLRFQTEKFFYETNEILGEGVSSIVYKASVSRRSTGVSLRGTSPPVALKCMKQGGEKEPVDLAGQLTYMHELELGGATWSVRGYEVFDAPDTGAKCLSMELLGTSLRKKRESNGKPFTLTYLATIGIQMIDVLDDMHNRFQFYHSDVHAGNWVFRTDDQLALIDYGYMRKLDKNSLDRISELKEMVMSLRWLIDMDNTYYAPKHTPPEKTMDDICPESIVPKQLRDIVEYTYALNANSADPYSIIRRKFEEILSHEGHTIPVRMVQAKSAHTVYIQIGLILVMILFA